MKTAGIILIIFSLCGIAWLGLSPFLTSLPDAEPQPTREILATPTIQQAQPTAILEPTATATPWYDLPATQAAIDGMNAQANAAQAEKDLLQKQIELGLSNTSNQLTLAESDRQTIALVAKVTLVFTYAEATKQAHIDKTDLEKTDKSIEARKVGMLEIGLWGVLIVAILYAFIMLVRLWRSIDYRESGDSIDDSEPIQAETHNAGYMEVMQLEDKDTVILRNAAARIAYHMTGLMSYRSVNEDCPDEAQRILRAEWTDVRAVLIDKKYNLAKEQVGGIQMSDAGIKVINGLLPH
jgi:hypothetical protein